jgi:hypothetical protein
MNDWTNWNFFGLEPVNSSMHIQKDFEELLRLLEGNSVKYLIVGGYAVAFHGFPRLTKDIDVFYDSSVKNARNIFNALLQFGFPKRDLKKDTFITRGNIITFGVEPVRVDFVNEISGVTFGDAWNNRVRGTYGDVTVNFIGREDLIKNKMSTPRPKDKLDVEELS